MCKKNKLILFCLHGMDVVRIGGLIAPDLGRQLYFIAARYLPQTLRCLAVTKVLLKGLGFRVLPQTLCWLAVTKVLPMEGELAKRPVPTLVLKVSGVDCRVWGQGSRFRAKGSRFTVQGRGGRDGKRKHAAQTPECSWCRSCGFHGLKCEVRVL